jgi:hypothetical protein
MDRNRRTKLRASNVDPTVHDFGCHGLGIGRDRNGARYRMRETADTPHINHGAQVLNDGSDFGLR